MRMQMKWIAWALVVLVLLSIGVYFVDRMTRCTANGLARGDALRIADEKLKTKFKGEKLTNEFLLVSEQFESDKSWLFTYRAKDCTVAIIIDKCGVADIGGISKACISR